MHGKLKLMRKQWQLYLFLLLPIAYVIIFRYMPILGSQIAFRKFSARAGIWGSPWVGFYYFEKFFNSHMFESVVFNTLAISVYDIFMGFPFAVLFALVLNTVRNHGMRRVIETVTYMPHFISTVVLVSILNRILNPSNGLYGTLHELLTNTTTEVNLISRSDMFRHLYVWSGIWQEFGYNSIIYIAALTAVSRELHEAAEIDGASRFKRMIHIDIPSILPTIIITLILRCGQVMTIGFEKVYLMQNDLNLQTAEIISTYVYKVGLSSAPPDFSYATAIGLFNAVINLTLITIVNSVAKRCGENSLW